MVRIAVLASFDGDSTVYAIHRTTGAIEKVRSGLPNRIVGAGVSTCAPLLEAVP